MSPCSRASSWPRPSGRWHSARRRCSGGPRSWESSRIGRARPCPFAGWPPRRRCATGPGTAGSPGCDGSLRGWGTRGSRPSSGRRPATLGCGARPCGPGRTAPWPACTATRPTGRPTGPHSPGRRRPGAAFPRPAAGSPGRACSGLVAAASFWSCGPARPGRATHTRRLARRVARGTWRRTPRPPGRYRPRWPAAPTPRPIARGRPAREAEADFGFWILDSGFCSKHQAQGTSTEVQNPKSKMPTGRRWR